MTAADVSFAMGGITSTEVARQASSIILLSDDFNGIIKVIMWGRAVKDSVKKYLLVSFYNLLTMKFACSHC
jgi:Ca2+-transporting ATPase